jgi:hypothetical protein
MSVTSTNSLVFLLWMHSSLFLHSTSCAHTLLEEQSLQNQLLLCNCWLFTYANGYSQLLSTNVVVTSNACQLLVLMAAITSGT